VTALHESDRGVEFVVEDAGAGVPGSELAHLFERFYRSSRQRGSRSGGGSGIGLTVVRGLAEAMGGSAEARRSEFGGLAIAVRLLVEGEPVAVEGAAGVEPEAAVAGTEAAAEPDDQTPKTAATGSSSLARRTLRGPE
jgi:hypothetical protein